MSLHTTFFYKIWEKVDIRKVKADQLTLLPPCMYVLSPQSGLKFGEEALGCYVDLFGNRYFIFFKFKIK